MPIVQTLITTWVCDICGRSDIHVAGTRSPLAAEHFIDRLKWRQLPAGGVVCDRCKTIPDVLRTLGITPSITDRAYGRAPAEIVHAAPHGDDAYTPCCGISPLQLPRNHRMTVRPELVTCKPPRTPRDPWAGL